MKYIFLKIKCWNENHDTYVQKWVSLDQRKILIVIKKISLVFMQLCKIIRFFLLIFKQKKECIFAKRKIGNFGKKKTNLFILDFSQKIALRNLYNRDLCVYFFGLEASHVRNRETIYFKLKNLYIEKLVQNFDRFSKPLFHQKDVLWNDFIDLCDVVNRKSKKNILLRTYLSFSVCMTESLWMIDGQYAKFWKRKIHGGKIILPSIFLVNCFGSKLYKDIWFKGRKMPQKNKNRPKILKELELRKSSQIMQYCFFENNFVLSLNERNCTWIDSFHKLGETFISYAEYNKICLGRTEKNHSRKSFRDFKKFMNIQTIEGVVRNNFVPQNSELKNKLVSELNKRSNYCPLNLSSFLPFDKIQRAKTLETIELSFPIEILKYFPGSNKRKMVICWKIPKNCNQRSLIKKNRLINKEILNFPLFYSRSMLINLKKKRK